MRSEIDLQVIYPEYTTESYRIRLDRMEEKHPDYSKILNTSLKRFFKKALIVSLRNPAQAYSFFHTVRHQIKSAKVRANLEQEGIHIPPIIIYSITNRCNLHCKGCYHQALRAFARPELNDLEMRRVVSEAKDLGVSFFVIAGGEPLVRKELFNITRDNPEIVFFVFTNGLMIDEVVLAKLKRQKNVVPIISMEGYEDDTDGRRGKGVYEQLQKTVDKLRRAGTFFGVSLTMTRTNLATVTDEKFVKGLTKQGCKLFMYVEYTPIREGTEDWVITEQQRSHVTTLMNSLRSRNSALFVALPNDEEQFGGCLAAGRGFVHISAEGNVEACPFAPYSDCNVREISLRDALQSRLLQAIRDNQEGFEEEAGGCALWDKREWVKSLIAPESLTINKPPVVEPEIFEPLAAITR
jgi:MoaA/NifB/PqqE/SkfB family radical SAM enzyme